MPAVGETMRILFVRTRRPNLLDLRDRRAGRGARQRQQPHVLLRLRGSAAAFLFGLAKLVQQFANLGDLAGRAADEQAARGEVGIHARRLRIRLVIVAAEELVDRDDRNLRIDVRQRDHIDLLRFFLHLVDRGAIVACCGGVANATTLPASLSAVRITFGSLCSSVCSIFTTLSGSAVVTA